MKLLTNDNNVNTLKILIASNWMVKPIDICKDSYENLFKSLKVPKTCPQLILESGTHISSSNAIVKFLFPPNNNNMEKVNYYLDLEASFIQPISLSFLTKASNESKKCFDDILNELQNELSSKEFLTDVDLTAADIVVWCSLYPLSRDQKVWNNLCDNRSSLKKWFDLLLENTIFQESLKMYPIQSNSGLLDNFISPNFLKTVSVLMNEEPSNSKASNFETSEKNGIIISEEEIQDARTLFMNKTVRSPKKNIEKVLPVSGERNILITSALPYVNNVPHLGNLIGCVLSGDVFARYCRLRNYNTLYICGTDEYGTATETKALEEGLTPKEICDKYFQIHDFIYKWFNISFDYFGRTSTPQQTNICQEIFKKIYKNGYIVADSVEQLLCEKCDRFLADRFVEGTCPYCAYVDARGDQCDKCGHLINAVELIEPRCKLCKEKPVTKQSKQFFLDLPKLEPLLKIWIEKSWANWSHNAREISKAWLNDGLKARCITRDLKWGIPVPIEGFEKKVFYVWFDAPIGYISITKLYTEEWQKWWLPEENTNVNLYQFMAKDNVPFHSVIFPASLLATKDNYVTVSHIFATEYLNYEDGKFSKSRGTGVFGNDAQSTGIPADVWRFYLLYVRPETQDSSFSWVDLALKNNSELLNVLGNFINRSLMFCEKTYDSIVPSIVLEEEDCELVALINRELNGYITMIEKGKLREGIRHLLAIARLGNQYIQTSQPWVLCKGSEIQKKRCQTVIGLSTNLSCLLAQLLDPYMPETSEVIRKQLNAPPEVNFIDDKFRLLLPSGHKIGQPFPLFVKLEVDQINKLKEKFSGNKKQCEASEKNDKPKESSVCVSDNVTELEAAVAAQGDLVRNMKKAGKDKSEWGPQVTILLNLKQKLEEAREKLLKLNVQETKKQQNYSESIEEMEEKVKKQGDFVRKLKESGADRSIWQPEVNILLELKKKLAEMKGEPLTVGNKVKANKKK